ncbi:MAG TPA: hypothetical protein VK256_11570, partial [Candidatus Eisenbacteria bacterium]|nr:hypothetical protein [Candidatus Eisenbacteria bacterium]
MGRGIPPGAGHQLTLRLRLLAAAAGIVAVSLLLAGALTWFLVRELVVQNVQEQLDRGVVAVTNQVKHQECLVRPALVSQPGAANCKLDPPVEFEDRLGALVVPTLSGNRLLLLDAQDKVVWDSGGTEMFVTTIPIANSRRVADVNIGEARTTLGGQAYIAAS